MQRAFLMLYSWFIVGQVADVMQELIIGGADVNASSGQPTDSPLMKAVKRKAQDVLHVLLHSEVRVTLDVWNFVLAALLAAQKKAGVKRFQAKLLANPAKVEQGLSQGHLLSHTHTLTLSLSLPPSLPPSLSRD